MHRDFPVGDDADVEARPAHVDHDHIALLDPFEPREAPSRFWRRRRTGKTEMHRLAHDLRAAGLAATRSNKRQDSLETGATQTPFELSDTRRDQWFQGG